MNDISNPGQISIDQYDYFLPDERIAQFPLKERDRSKLLIYKDGDVSDDTFNHLSKHLPADSIVVINETRVIHARLIFHKSTGSNVEIFCLEPLNPYRDHQLALQVKKESEWLCLVGNSKRWKEGIIRLQMNMAGQEFCLEAERLEKMPDGTSKIKFRWQPEEVTMADVLEHAGKIPLPPYIHRQPVMQDNLTYQTVYASSEGSVAAPTAGLHFTNEVMASLKEKKIDLLKFILHVGAGTFKPVTASRLEGHHMHTEQIHLNLNTLVTLQKSLHLPISAVGTTTVRLLESLHWHGVKTKLGLSDATRIDVRQWDPYTLDGASGITREEALDAVISGCLKAGTNDLHGSTSLLIAPGYEFMYPDILITNFHQPKSTLLLLIAAFIGNGWRDAYAYALEKNFRFLSYGDSCILFKH